MVVCAAFIWKLYVALNEKNASVKVDVKDLFYTSIDRRRMEITFVIMWDS